MAFFGQCVKTGMHALPVQKKNLVAQDSPCSELLRVAHGENNRTCADKRLKYDRRNAH